MVMATCILLSVVLINIVLHSCGQALPEIIQDPENKTVFLHQSAVFTCGTRGGTSSWLIGGILLEELEQSSPEIRADISTETNISGGMTMETLTIPAKAHYNGTRVQCVVFALSGSVQSDNATLKIQGPLSAVGDLRATSNAGSVTISWSAPFSLDVTGVDPDIWYSVLIYNATDENNPTAILCTDCTNITEIHYTFTPECFNKYDVSVVPSNGAGQGERSGSLTINLFPVIETHIEALSRSECRVTFSPSDEFSGLCNFNILFEELNSCFSFLREPRSLGGELTICDLAADKEYSLPLIYFNGAGGVTTIVINFTTFDVQSATVNAASNGIAVTVNFITNTTATGCFIVLQSEDGSPDEFRALSRPESETTLEATIDNIPPSTYTALFYDLEQDGLPNSNVAYEGNQITVAGAVTDATSRFLQSGSELFLTGSAVNVTCVFKEGVEGASCVLVYREYGNKTLVVEEYPQNTVFPVTMTIDDDLEKYTFALFGQSNSDIDGRPIVTKKLQVSASPSTQSPTVTSTDVGGHSTNTNVALVLALVLTALVLTALVGVIVGASVIGKRRSIRNWRVRVARVEVFMTTSHHKPEYPENEKTSQEQIKTGVQADTSPQQIFVSADSKSQGQVSESDKSPLTTTKAEKGSKYTLVETVFSGAQPTLPIDSSVQYQEIDIRATHKMARCAYADLGPLPTNRAKPPKIETKTQGPYVDVVPHAATPVNANRDNKNADKATPKGPPTVESVMSLLWGVAGRWKEIAKGLKFDEDLIDEIDTNNDMDEGCLQVCVEMWIFKLHPSWEKLSRALKELGEVELARQAGNKEPIQQSPSRKISDATSGIGTGCDVSPALSRLGDRDSGGGEGVTGDEGEVKPLRQTTFPNGDKASSKFTLRAKNPLFNIESYQLTPVEYSSGKQTCSSEAQKADDAGFVESGVESGTKDWHPKFVCPQTSDPSYDSSARAEERDSYKGGVEVDQKPRVENFNHTTTSIDTANIEAEDVVVNDNIGDDGTTVVCTESSNTEVAMVMVTGRIQETYGCISSSHCSPFADLRNVQAQPVKPWKTLQKHTPPLPKFRAQTLQGNHPQYPLKLTHKYSSNSHAMNLTLTWQWTYREDLRCGPWIRF